jgi:hypothetical protein
MSFRLIRNRAQQIAVIGFIITLVICVLLSFFNVAIYITLPFLMVWIMVYLLGSSVNRKRIDNENDK